MDTLLIAHFLNGFLMIAIPIGLGIYLTRRWKFSGRIWWIGGATFILSQVGHIPFNWAIGKLLNQSGMVSWNPTIQLFFNASFLGLSAGIFEEGTRYLVLRWWAKDARSWRNSVLFGAGHGGAEAILLGVLVLYGFFQMVALRGADLATLIPASQQALAQRQITTYWSATWYFSLFGALERIFTIPCQIVMAVMVMQVFIRGQIRWLFVAIGYHTLLGASAVINLEMLGTYWTEAIIGLFAILSVILIFVFRKPEPTAEVLSPGFSPALIMPEPVEENLENLDKTRYQ
jgi:uncharacterized membrane protein YhfC